MPLFAESAELEHKTEHMRPPHRQRQNTLMHARDTHNRLVKLLVRNIVAADDVALAGAPFFHSGKETFGDDLDIDHADPAHRIARHFALVDILDDTPGVEVDVTRAENEGWNHDHHIHPFFHLRSHDLLGGMFGAGIFEVDHIEIPLTLFVALAVRPADADRRDGADMHHPPHFRPAAGVEHVLRAIDIDFLKQRIFAVAHVGDARAVIDLFGPVERSMKRSDVGNVAVNESDPVKALFERGQIGAGADKRVNIFARCG